MASELFTTEYDPAATVYLILIDSSGNVFDANDNTFKVVGSVVDPVAATVSETALPGGDQSRYGCTVDLANINSTLAETTYWYQWRRQLGASPDLTIDEPVTDLESAVIRAARFNPDLQLVVRPNYQQDSDTASFWIYLTDGGEKVDLGDISPAVGIVIDVRMEGAGADLFQGTAASPNANGEYYVTFSTPGFGSDIRLFRADINIGSGDFTAFDVFLGAA